MPYFHCCDHHIVIRAADHKRLSSKDDVLVELFTTYRLLPLRALAPKIQQL